MPEDSAPGQVPEGQESPDEEMQQIEGHYDEARALRTISKLKSYERKARELGQKLRDYEERERAAEQEKLSERERLQQQLDQTRSDLATARQAAQDRATEAAIEREAAKLQIIDPEAARRLLSPDALERDSEGRPLNIAAALRALVKDKPYLAQQTTPGVGATNGPTRAPGGHGSGGRIYTKTELATMDFQTYRKVKDDVGLAIKEGRVTDG